MQVPPLGRALLSASSVGMTNLDGCVGWAITKSSVGMTRQRKSFAMYDFAMKFKLSAISVLLGLAMQVSGQVIPAPDVPEKIKAPAGEEVVLVAHASGSQIYVCQAGQDGKTAWTLKAPDAELRDGQGAAIGSHYGGPTWKYKDGSTVTGKASARVDSPDAGSIPWLLITATGHSGDGLLGRVSSIQRVNTKGGVAPANACEQGAESKSAYTADYYFYAPGK